jgi:DNA-binding LacI/PurR family transcriptional regulator
VNLMPQRASLVAQILAVLKDGIRAGLWKGQLPGEMALCERLQVSRVTLRAALDHLQREKWCTARQGKRRSILFSPLQDPETRRRDAVVLLSPLPLQKLPASAMFWVDSLRGHLATAGYHLEFVSSAAAYSHHPQGTLESLVHKSQAAGWVLYVSTEPLQQWFSQRALPCVICGSRHAEVRLCSVDIDYGATCSHAAGLLAARGRKQLALLMPRSQQAGNLESERGFLEAVQRQPGVKGHVAHHDGTVPAICATLDRLLQSQWPVNGLVVAKPAHVATAVTHLLRRGVKLPQDLSLISRDDDPLLEYLVPIVARYHVQPAVFARKICRLVIDVVQSGARRRRDSRVMPTLIQGETLG